VSYDLPDIATHCGRLVLASSQNQRRGTYPEEPGTYHAFVTKAESDLEAAFTGFE
ncbi:unnamed protein product, partial [Effrenium voratum]